MSKDLKLKGNMITNNNKKKWIDLIYAIKKKRREINVAKY